jgi:hypothetical protein
MTGANNELTVHINLELPEDQVGMDEMQLVNTQLAELIGQVLRMDDTDEV